MTDYPLQCTVNYRSGTIRCLNQDNNAMVFNISRPTPTPAVRRLLPLPRMQMLDSPLNRILTRQAVGPWEVVGAAVASDKDTSTNTRAMLVYAQSVDTARNRYNYRVIDNNNVPLDLEYKVAWKDDHAPLHIPGYPHKYHLHLYDNYTTR